MFMKDPLLPDDEDERWCMVLDVCSWSDKKRKYESTEMSGSVQLDREGAEQLFGAGGILDSVVVDAPSMSEAGQSRFMEAVGAATVEKEDA